MSNKFKIIWEDNPDTPLSASNLSKYVERYSEGSILYKDTDDFTALNMGDNLLKIRANTKISLPISITNAFFSFDNESLISHDSKNFPLIADNVSFRIESLINDSGSIAFEEGTTNLVSNPSFENDLTDWTVELENSATTNSNVSIYTSNDNIYGNKAAEMYVDNVGNEVRLKQTINLTNNLSPASLSFYYKTNNDLKVLVEGNPGSSIFWNPISRSWNGTPYPIDLPIAAGWQRFEIKNIIISSLDSSNTRIVVHFYSEDLNTTHYIDAVQVEKKEFCSSFTDNSRLDSNLILSNNIIKLDEGTIDIQLMPKIFDESKYIFTLTTNNASIDAMKLFYDKSSSQLVFSVYDANSQTDLEATITYIVNDFNYLVDNWTRIICSWNKDKGIKIYTDNKSTIINQTYIPVQLSELNEFQIGRRNSDGYLNGLIDHLKFNLFEKNDDSIVNDFALTPSADPKHYKIYENDNSALIINNKLLDTGTEIDANSIYFVWLCDSGLNSDSADIVLSKNSLAPYGYDEYLSKIIGGFSTDNNGDPIVNSIWDIRSEDVESINTERIVIHGRDSNNNNIEFRSTPYSDANDAKFNIPTTFTDHIYGNNGTNFFDLDNAGILYMDSIKIDSNYITTKDDVELLLTAYGTKPVHISASTVDIDATNIDIDSSGAGMIQLDDVRIKTNKIYSVVGQDLLIQNDQGTSKIILHSINSYIESQSDIQIDASKKLIFDDSLQTKVDFYPSSNYSMGIQTDSLYLRTNSHINFFKQGVHNDTKYDPGTGGTLLATITNNEAVSNIDPNSRFYAGKVFNAIYNDLAECWIRDEKSDINYGDVVVQTKNGIVKSSKRAQKGTIGIVSDSFGYILGSDGFDDKNIKKSKKLPVAISGRVQVKIKKEAEIGDELVAYKDGFAIKANIFERLFKRSRIIGIVDSIKKTGKVWVKV